MIIEHIIGIFSPEHGGPVVSLGNYARGQAAAGLDVRVRTVDGYRQVSPVVRLEAPIDQQVFPLDWPHALGRSGRLASFLREETAPDAYHLHGAWLRAMYYGFREARRRSRPCLVEVNGAYQPYELARKPWRKRLVRRWFQDGIFQRASCLHVNSSKEAEEMRSLGFRTPMVVIPAGFSPPAAASDAAAAAKCPWPEVRDRPFVLYLARLHPNKGLELLLRAWSSVRNIHPDMRLLIVGAGDAGYVKSIRQLASDLALDAACVWKGFVSESEKTWAYRHARFYCLPSFTENFGNTVQEALGHGTPVLTTTATPWRELPEVGCGWIADCTVESLEAKLRQALGLAPERLKEMGEIGRAYILREFSLASVLRKQIATYQWLLGGPAPTAILFP